MKLCWDNIENIRLTKRGNLRDKVNGKTYYYNESCENCGNPFLGKSIHGDRFCDNQCADIYNSKRMKQEWNDKNSIYHTTVKDKISKTVKDLWKDKDSIYNNKKYKIKQKQGSKKKANEEGRREILSKNMKEAWKNTNNKLHSKERTIKIKEGLKKAWKRKNSRFNSDEYKNNKHIGYQLNGLVFYDTYAPQLEWVEKVRRNKEDPNILEVKCFKCGKWFIPTFNSVHNRIQVLKGNYNGEYLLYCSDGCKKSCSIYRKTPEVLMKEDAVRAGRLQWLELSREVQPELRQMVLERDSYTCQKCNSNKNLQCHHIQPVTIEPLLSADIDNCITLCYNCHKEVHQKDGCRYGQLRIKEC